MDCFERIDTIETALSELSGEQVYRLFTGWHGLQLLDEGFYQYLVDEGIIPEDEDDDDDDDDDGGIEWHI